MSGHSKWSTIKHKKGAKDAKRGKLFTKLIKEITVAAKLGGGDVKANPRLRTAVAVAKQNSMPSDNIDRAIKKGTGELEGVTYDEVQYEGYGPGGLAVLVNAMTDNRNRTVSELRRVFQKSGGAMGEAGCVAWMFSKRGLITVANDAVEEDRLIEIAIDAGAEDVASGGEAFEVTTQPDAFEAVKDAIEKAGLKAATAELTMIASTNVSLTGDAAEQALKLLEELEDHDDVQDVASNLDIPQEELERLSAA